MDTYDLDNAHSMTFKERLRAVSGFAVAIGLVFAASVYTTEKKSEFSASENNSNNKDSFNRSAKARLQAATSPVVGSNKQYVITFEQQ